MTEFLIYQGKAAIVLAVFYMFYRLLLSKETFHRFNRIVLLGTAALSFVLPLCVITFKEVVVVPAMTGSSEAIIGEVAETVTMVPEVSVPIWTVVLFDELDALFQRHGFWGHQTESVIGTGCTGIGQMFLFAHVYN